MLPQRPADLAVILALALVALGGAALAPDGARTRQVFARRVGVRPRALGEEKGGTDLLERLLPGGATGTGRATKPPRMCRIVLHNDARMSGEVVYETLQQIFRKRPDEAMQLMLAAHRAGQASVTIETCEIAETRVERARAFSRQRMEALFGLRNEIRLTVVPEDRA